MLAKSTSSAEMCNSLPATLKRIWWVVLLAKMDTRLVELSKDVRSRVILFGLSRGMTAS